MDPYTVCGAQTTHGDLCPECQAFAVRAGLTPEELSRHWRTMLSSSGPTGEEFKRQWRRLCAGLSPDGTQPDTPWTSPGEAKARCRACGTEIPAGKVLCLACQESCEYVDWRERELQAQAQAAASLQARRRALAAVLPLLGAILAMIAALRFRPGDERLYLSVAFAAAGGVMSALGAASPRKWLYEIGLALGPLLLFYDAVYVATQDLGLALQISGALAAAGLVLWAVIARVVRAHLAARGAPVR